MSLIPALGRQRQADLYKFKASPVYRVSSGTAKATQTNPDLKKKKSKPQLSSSLEGGLPLLT